MPILNYTTKISSIKTIGEISECLVKHGVKKIVTDYDDEGLATGLTFWITVEGKELYFALPCNWQGVLNAMEKDRKIPRSALTKEQAIRVSWRILKDWVEAQMAIVEAQIASTAQVFLPYTIARDGGETLYEKLMSGKIKMLN